MMNQYDSLTYIISHSSEASLYEQLAEEAVELAHAAQKIARYLRGEQPLADDFDLEKTKTRSDISHANLTSSLMKESDLKCMKIVLVYL